MDSFEILDVCERVYSGKSYTTKYNFSENELFILYVKSGKCKAASGGESFALSSGNFLISTGENSLSYQFSSSQKTCVFCARAKICDIASFLKIFSLSGGVFHSFKAEKAEEIFAELKREFLINSLFSKSRCQAFFTELLCTLSSSRTPVSVIDSECARLFEDITDNFLCEIDVSLYAQRAGLSRDRFSMIFKERYGPSPYKYQLSLKMKEATFLLTHTDLPVHEIARMLGFSTPLYFSSAYKTQTGLSPTRVRKPVKSCKNV